MAKAAPTSNITFTLFDRLDGLDDSSAVVLGSVTLTPSTFTNSYQPVTFDIKGLDLLSSATDVTDFSVRLTSSTPHNKTYHIKGGDFAVDPATLVHIWAPLLHTHAAAVPEPSTLVLSLIALAPLSYLMGRRRRRVT